MTPTPAPSVGAAFEGLWWVPLVAVAISVLALGLGVFNAIAAHRDRRTAREDRDARLAADALVKLDLVLTHYYTGGRGFPGYRHAVWTLHNSGNATVWNPLAKLADDETIAFSAIGAVPPGGQLAMRPVGDVDADFELGWTGAPALALWEDAKGVTHETEIRASHRES